MALMTTVPSNAADKSSDSSSLAKGLVEDHRAKCLTLELGVGRQVAQP